MDDGKKIGIFFIVAGCIALIIIAIVCFTSKTGDKQDCACDHKEGFKERFNRIFVEPFKKKKKIVKTPLGKVTKVNGSKQSTGKQNFEKNTAFPLRAAQLRSAEMTRKPAQKDTRKVEFEKPLVKPEKKEGFIASGTNGAWYDAQNNAVRGDNIYSNQMIQNNKTWSDVVNVAKKDHIASDGRGTLGAGLGNGFEEAYKSQVKIANAWGSVDNGYMTNEEFQKLSKEINTTTAPQSDTSLLNRGNQNRGKMKFINDKLICVIPEKYMDERSKNYDIYKTNSVIYCKGYDIDTNRVGDALMDTNFSKYVKNSNKRRVTSAGTSANLFVGDQPRKEDNAAAESFKDRYVKSPNTESFTNGSDELQIFNNDDGGKWITRNGVKKVY